MIYKFLWIAETEILQGLILFHVWVGFVHNLLSLVAFFYINETKL